MLVTEHAVTRARGVKMGNPNGAAALRRASQADVALRAAVSVNADRFAADLAGVIADIRGTGHLTLRATAAASDRGDVAPWI